MPEFTMTGAAARKIGRLSSLRPDADVVVSDIEDDAGRPVGDGEAIRVDFLDEWSLRPERSFIVRQNGWSNPSLARARAELADVR